MTLPARDRIFVALDTADPARALALGRALRGRVGGLKIGLEAFVSAGPGLVREVLALRLPVFLDLKLHDIPATVEGAARAAGRLGAALLTVHGLGGERMIAAAVRGSREGAEEAGAPPPRILAVTVLTSHDEADLARIGLPAPASRAVERLAALAADAGAGGVVCSPLEIGIVRRAFPEATVVVPGIRPRGAARNDQARVTTPREAVAAGADRLVIGRPITGAPDPAAAADAIASEIEGEDEG